MQSVNSPQFLNITPSFLLSDCFAASLSPSLVIAIVPRMYASLRSHKRDF